VTEYLPYERNTNKQTFTIGEDMVFGNVIKVNLKVRTGKYSDYFGYYMAIENFIVHGTNAKDVSNDCLENIFTISEEKLKILT
jgi:hypothetical protein